MQKSWFEEAKASRKILFSQWEILGKPQKEFYAWLVDQVDNSIRAARGQSKLDLEYFKKLEEN